MSRKDLEPLIRRALDGSEPEGLNAEEVCSKLGLEGEKMRHTVGRILKRSPHLFRQVDKKSRRGRFINADSLPAGQAEPQAVVRPPRVRLQDFKAGDEVAALLDELVPQLEAMLGENTEIKSEAERLAADCAARAGELRDAEAYIQLLEQESVAIEERLRLAKEQLRRAHSTTLEEIALAHPEVPQLVVLAEELKQAGNKREEKLQQLRARLPQSFSWANDRGKIVYGEQLLRALVELTEEEQEQVVRQLGVLSEQGAEHASLHTNKSRARIRHSPSGCMVSRGAGNLRFTWTKENGSDVVVYWVFRRGDSRVRYTEA